MPEDERLALEQLLVGYTKNGAYQLRMEEQLGSIQIGMLADFIVLDADLFAIESDRIASLKPRVVVMEGKVIQGSFYLSFVSIRLKWVVCNPTGLLSPKLAT